VIVTVSNNKGGVGKTALAAHLVFRAAEHGRVLAIDLDSQSNLTATLIARADKHGRAASDGLFTEIDLPQPMATVDANIDLLPAAAGLTGVDRQNLSSGFSAMGHIKSLAKQYDAVVIDTPARSRAAIDDGVGVCGSGVGAAGAGILFGRWCGNRVVGDCVDRART
jgi:chromosome partitioning protein